MRPSRAATTSRAERVPRARRIAASLTPLQVKWLGAMLFAAQLPQVPNIPIWVAAFALALIGVRLWLLTRDRSRPDAAAARIPSWALVLFAILAALIIRASYGTLLGRDPWVAFTVVLASIKFLEAR